MSDEIKMEEQVVEDQTFAESYEMSKQKKKKTKKKIIIPIIIVAVLLVIVLIVLSVKSMTSNIGMPVTVTKTLKGDLEQTMDTSGTVVSEETQVYFAEVGTKIKDINVIVGDGIKKDQQIISYDTTDLELAEEKAQLQADVSDIEVKIASTNLNETSSKAAEAVTNYEDATKYVNHFTSCLEQAQLQLGKANELLAKQAALTERIMTAKVNLETNPTSETYKSELAAAQAELLTVNDALTKYDVAGLQNAVKICSEDLAEYKAIMKENEAKKETSDSLALQKSQQNAIGAVNELSKEQIGKDLEIAKKGVTANFGGIVTKIDVVKGQEVAAGAPLFTVESDQKVKVSINVSKYDLEHIAVGQTAKVKINGKEYTGTVSKINRMAVVNAAGAAMVSAEIHIDKPDENIYLGIEAKASVLTASAKDVLLVPVECVNYDTDGTFCYVAVDGVLVRKEVKVGITSDKYIEISSGLVEGDQIVTNVTSTIEEGMKVTPIMEQ